MTPTKNKKTLKFHQLESEKKTFDMEAFISNSRENLNKNNIKTI